MVISREILEKTLPFLASTRSLLCLTFDHLLCPAMLERGGNLEGLRRERGAGGGRQGGCGGERICADAAAVGSVVAGVSGDVGADAGSGVGDGGGVEGEDEEIDIIEMTREEMMNTRFKDFKTIIAVQWARYNHKV